MNQFLPLLLIFVVMYMFVIRPQIKRQKQEKRFISELKKGDNVVTKSGLHGKIAELSDTSFVLETMAGKLRFERSSVSAELSSKMSSS